MSAHQTLSIASIKAARRDLNNQLGSQKPAKPADVAALDLPGLSFQTRHYPVSPPVYAATLQQAGPVWIDGIQLLAEGVVTPRSTQNTQQVRDYTRQWHNTISQFGSR